MGHGTCLLTPDHGIFLERHIHHPMSKSKSKSKSRHPEKRNNAQSRVAPRAQPAALRRLGGTFFPKPAVWLFLLCFSAYTLNGAPSISSDQMANMFTSVNLLKNHSFTITPKQIPASFAWFSQRPGEEGKQIKINRWGKEMASLYETGQITARPRYYLVESVHPGHYVNVFGVGAALTALPVYGLLNLFTDIASNHFLWWHAAKLLAAALIALSAVLIFLSMRRFVSLHAAFFGALAFGLGSCAWSISSQALWQQTPAMFFLALGAWCLFGSEERKHFPLYCGAALGAAALCRPTGVFAVICVGLYFLVVGRHDVRKYPLKYALGVLPFAAAIWLYNDYYLGSPFTFAQGVVGQSISMGKTGSSDIWQTPFFVGLGGLLFSPSRGLLFFSPLLLLGFVGAGMLWHNPRKYAPLIPLLVAVLMMLIPAAKRFDWWGGWTYGPRLLVDVGVFLTLLMIPVLDKVFIRLWMRRVLVALFVYSFAVQGVGAWAYNFQWDNKDNMNIDRPEYRYRLWAWNESQIWHYMANFQSERKIKQAARERAFNQKSLVVEVPGEMHRPESF